MTRFVGTPLRGVEFANAGDEAFSGRVSGDSAARLRIDAGGRLTWGDGTGSGDVTLYRGDANQLKTDDSLYAANGIITLTTTGAPTASLPDGAIAIDTNEDRLYLRSNNAWVKAGSAVVELATTAPTGVDEGDMWFDTDDGVLSVYSSSSWVSVTASTTLDDLFDVNATAPNDGDVLQYDSASGEWVSAAFYALPTGGSTGQVLSKVDSTDYNVQWADAGGSANLDGGASNSNYGGIPSVNGGTA